MSELKQEAVETSLKFYEKIQKLLNLHIADYRLHNLSNLAKDN